MVFCKDTQERIKFKLTKEPEEKKGRTGYFATNMDPHETLYLESNEDGTVSIKYYEYKEAINWESFATKVHNIEDALNAHGYYLQGRVDRAQKQVIETEVKDNAKLEAQVSVKGQDSNAVVKKYLEKKKELGNSHA